MPRKTKVEAQAELASIMETLFAVSVALDEDSGGDQEMDQEDIDEDNAADVLLLAGIECMDDVCAMSEDLRGPYGQIQRSKDWLPVALQAPDRDFRRTFR
jgi:hypothetical protein